MVSRAVKGYSFCVRGGARGLCARRRARAPTPLPARALGTPPPAPPGLARATRALPPRLTPFAPPIVAQMEERVIVTDYYDNPIGDGSKTESEWPGAPL